MDGHKKNLSQIQIDRIIFWLALGVAIFISIAVLLQRGLSFDGAFNTQAALNLYSGKGLTLEYDIPSYHLQTGLPFQILNGFFLTLFGRNFVVTNFANICFYWLLFWLVLDLSRKTSSPIPLLSFIVISFLPVFQRFGFGGYGELPSLMLAVIGAYIIIQYYNNYKFLFLGSALIAFAIATKWIMVFVIPPILLICLIVLLRGGYKPILWGGISFGFVLCVCLLIQYYPYDAQNINYLLNALWKQGTQSPYVDPYIRLSVFLNEYEMYSGFKVLAWIKLILVSFLGIIIGSRLVSELKRRREYFCNKNIELFFIFLVFFTLVYLGTWFFLQEKAWYRRVFNSDILLLLSISLIPYIYKNSKLKKIMTYLTLIIILIFGLCYLPLYFANFEWNDSALDLENNLNSGLKLLPDEFNGYGYGWWQAPRWSFLHGQKFENIFDSPVIYSCLAEETACYVFFENENVLDPSSTKLLEDNYELKEIFVYGKYKIKKIIGLNIENAQFVHDIDFSKGDFEDSINNFCNREQNSFRHSKIESYAFMNNSNRYTYVVLEFSVAPRLKDLVLKGVISPENYTQAMIYDIPFNVGDNLIALNIPSDTGQELILIISLLEGYVPPIGDARKPGITFRRISMTNSLPEDVIDVMEIYPSIAENNSELDIFLRLTNGWHGLEKWNGVPTRWTRGDAHLDVHANSDYRGPLKATIKSFYHPRTLEIYINDFLEGRIEVPTRLTEISIPISLHEGSNVVRFYIPEGCDRPSNHPELNNSDGRCLSIAFQSISINR